MSIPVIFGPLLHPGSGPPGDRVLPKNQDRYAKPRHE